MNVCANRLIPLRAAVQPGLRTTTNHECVAPSLTVAGGVAESRVFSFLWVLAGMLGIGSVDHYVDDPVLVTNFDASKLIVQVASGLSHSAALASDGEASAGALCLALVAHCYAAAHCAGPPKVIL